MFRPFICTCNKRPATLKKFIESYKTVASSLKRPVVFHDGTDLEYMRLLEELNPAELILQPPGTLKARVCSMLPTTMAGERYVGEHTLFLEDDILFSSLFLEAIALLYERMLQFSQVHICTLYGSGNAYWPPNDENFLYRFNGYHFYGNLCLAISPLLMTWWKENLERILNYPYPWDLAIGRGFEDAGFQWYCTKKHYVQHQIGYSVLKQGHKEQQSNLFVP